MGSVILLPSVCCHCPGLYIVGVHICTIFHPIHGRTFFADSCSSLWSNFMVVLLCASLGMCEMNLIIFFRFRFYLVSIKLFIKLFLFLFCTAWTPSMRSVKLSSMEFLLSMSDSCLVMVALTHNNLPSTDTRTNCHMIQML